MEKAREVIVIFVSVLCHVYPLAFHQPLLYNVLHALLASQDLSSTLPLFQTAANSTS